MFSRPAKQLLSMAVCLILVVIMDFAIDGTVWPVIDYDNTNNIEDLTHPINLLFYSTLTGVILIGLRQLFHRSYSWYKFIGFASISGPTSMIIGEIFHSSRDNYWLPVWRDSSFFLMKIAVSLVISFILSVVVCTIIGSFAYASKLRSLLKSSAQT